MGKQNENTRQAEAINGLRIMIDAGIKTLNEAARIGGRGMVATMLRLNRAAKRGTYYCNIEVRTPAMVNGDRLAVAGYRRGLWTGRPVRNT